MTKNMWSPISLSLSNLNAKESQLLEYMQLTFQYNLQYNVKDI